MIKLARKVAAIYMRRLLRDRNKGRVASVMEKAFDEYDELVDAMADEPELMGDVLESLVNLGDISYHDGAFYYKDSTRLASKRTMLADQAHKQSIALMRFLSDVASRHGIGDHVYVVGGAVRNFVIDRPIKDIDVVIDSVKAGKDSEWFAKQLQQAIPAKTSLQTNQYGVAILSVNESWKVDGEELQGEVIEIANARKESYGGEGGKGYKPHMVEPSTIEEDIKRREFTFNTLLWQLSQLAHGPDEAEIIDLTGCGLDDLEEGVMKCPSDPDKTFSDDPTRMLRAVKFMVKYDFEIHRIVEKAIRRNARKLKKAPHNAISDILVNDILEMSQSRQTLDVLDDLGLLDVIKDMLEDSKPFRKTLLNWAKRNAEVMFLFDMMDIGLPLHSRFRFLDKAQTARLRTISVELGNREADKFLDLLKQPGRQMDTGALIQEFGLQGREVKNLMDVARDVLLEQPALRKSPRNLTEAVKNKFRKVASTRVSSDYYRATGDEDLEEVARMWAEEGKQVRGGGVHGYYSVRELWPLREYTWTRAKARGGRVETEDGWVDLPGPQKWDHLKAELEANGWSDDYQPLIIQFGKDGNVKVAEGNHRLAIAKEIGLRKIPVKFMFQRQVNNGHSLV